MKSFRQFVFEQKKPPPKEPFPMAHPMGLSLDPYDSLVIEAFFNGEPDVVGTHITTKQNDDADFNNEILRIDLLDGRARLGVVALEDDVIYLGELGTMVDDTEQAQQVQSIVRNMAREKDIRVI